MDPAAKETAVDNAPLLLVVDDDQGVQMMLQATLEEAGYAVLAATRGEEALRYLDRQHNELHGLITDVDLGGNNSGWDVARHAREISPAMPVIYMTGGSANAWSAQGVPGSVLVAKPFAPAQITSAISSLLNISTPQQSSE